MTRVLFYVRESTKVVRALLAVLLSLPLTEVPRLIWPCAESFTRVECKAAQMVERVPCLCVCVCVCCLSYV